jgi:hypothetical protein
MQNFSHLAEFFSKICRQPMLGPGNSAYVIYSIWAAACVPIPAFSNVSDAFFLLLNQ